jgi:hypothetical protein
LNQRGQRELEEQRAERAIRDNRRERLRDAYQALVLAAREIRGAILERAYQSDNVGNVIVDTEKDAKVRAALQVYIQTIKKAQISLILDDPEAVKLLDKYSSFAFFVSDPGTIVPPWERTSREATAASLNRGIQRLNDCLDELVARARNQLDALDKPATTIRPRKGRWQVQLPFRKPRPTS